MAEWLYEDGIGENRAILVEDDHILEAAIELPGALRFGSVVEGRLTEILIPGRRGLVESGDGTILVEPLPTALTKGQKVRVEIVREEIPEVKRLRVPKGRITEESEREGPTLAKRIGTRTRASPIGADHFEEAGWSELFEEAVSGVMAFTGGELLMSLTPAMTLFDVDGALPPAALAVAGAEAAGRTIRRLGIAGSIGIDLPTIAAKGERQRAALALDAVLPQPFERTAVNGFGFLQIVRRRQRASLPEQLQFEPTNAAARALLRRAERSRGAGEHVIIAPPNVIQLLENRPDWLAELRRRTGRGASLRADPTLTTFAGHVQSAVPSH